jgi:hypothetical protein
VNIEGVMVAAGQNLKRLIKHNLGMLFSFLKFTFSCLIFPAIPDFFNRLIDFTTKNRLTLQNLLSHRVESLNNPVIHIDKYENMYIIKIVNENDYSYNLGSQSLKRGGIIQPTEMRRSGPMISLSPFYA